MNGEIEDLVYERLALVYTDDEATDWMYTGHDDLAGLSPMEAIHECGRGDEVLAIADRLASGAYI